MKHNETDEAMERSEEVKAWLSDEKHQRTEKTKTPKAKVRTKKDIFHAGLGAKKKRGERKDASKEKMLTSELIKRFDESLESIENKKNEIQNLLDNNELDNRKAKKQFDRASCGNVKNNYTKFLGTKYGDEDDTKVIENSAKSAELVLIATQLEKVLYESIKRQLTIRKLITEFAKDFTKENFQADEKIDLKMVDRKIREQKELRDFYDAITFLSYHNLMTELALRIAIINTAVESILLFYSKLLLAYPLDYSRYEEIDKELLERYTRVLALVFSELVITPDDDCPDDADENLKAAYELNNNLARLYAKIKEPADVIAESVVDLKNYLAEKKNYGEGEEEEDKQRDEISQLLRNVEGAEEDFSIKLYDEGEEGEFEEEYDDENDDKVVENQKMKGSVRRELNNRINTNSEVLADEILNHFYGPTMQKGLVTLEIEKVPVIDLIETYNEAKAKDNKRLWKAFEAKKKNLPNIQATVTALNDIHQLENGRQKMLILAPVVPPQKIVEEYYRQCTGSFEIIFRNLTSITTYICNTMHRQPTDIATDGPDGELIQTVESIGAMLREFCRHLLDNHHANSSMIIYQNLFNNADNEDYLYYVAVENQIIEMIRKYLPIVLMPSMSGTGEAISQVNAMLEKYDDQAMTPSEIRDAMPERDRIKMSSLITEIRTDINNYMSWHTDSKIETLYSLYDFTIYSPETLIKRTKPKDLAKLYLATSERSTQANRLLEAERDIDTVVSIVEKVKEENLYPKLKECANSYKTMLRMFRQFYMLFNERNLRALEILRENEELQDPGKEIMFCSKEQAPQIKKVLMNFVRSYVKFSKQYILLVQEYLNSIENFYSKLPDFDMNAIRVIEYAGESISDMQQTLMHIQTSMQIIQNDEDPMIAKYMKTLLAGISKCWVGDLDSKSAENIYDDFIVLADRLINLDKNKPVTKTEAQDLVVALKYKSAPLRDWVKRKLELTKDNK